VTARHEAEDALRRRIAELDTLQRMSALLAGPIDLETALDSACRQLSQLFEAIWSEVHLLTAPPESVQFGAGGCDNEAEDGAVAAAIHAAASGGSPVTGSCAQGQHLLAVPLIAQAEIIGALVIARGPGTPEFSLHELTVAGTAADLLAAVISAERLHDIETEQATAKERQRLARDLHDAVVQIIYSASLMVEALPATWEQDQVQGRNDLLVVRRLIRAALAEMRILLFELRPEALAVDSVQTLLERLSDALAWRNELAVELDVEEDLVLPEDVRTVFYRVAQEALNNSAEHSGASELSVRVALQGEAVRLTVHDDGCGFDTAETGGGLGIGAMRERAASIGAALAIESNSMRGTTVMLDWPVPSFEGE
jgi:signal transduction histidine kinase